MRKRIIYTMAELSLCMMKMFNSFNEHYFSGELPKVIITYEAGFKKGAYGWIYSNKTWISGKDERYCINISSDYLDRPIYDICSTLLHEMCHLYALEKDIKDTSRSGIYHNKKFKEIAESHGLSVEVADIIGYSVTKLTEETKIFVDSVFSAVEIRLYQKKPKEKNGKAKVKTSRRKYVCPCCGTQITATKEVSVICGECYSPDVEPVYFELVDD